MRSILQALIVLSFIFVLILPAPVNAGLADARFFNRDRSAWNASDIIVVSEGWNIDGHVTVRDVLVGDIPVGENLIIPELKQFADRESRIPHRYSGDFSGITGWFSKNFLTPCVSGNEILVFLTSYKPVVGANGEKTLHLATSTDGGWPTSLAWLEQDDVYYLTTIAIPGGLTMVKSHENTSEFRESILEAVTTRDFLEVYNHLEFSEHVFRSMIALSKSKLDFVMDKICESLLKHSPEILPMIRRYVHQTSEADEVYLLALLLIKLNPANSSDCLIPLLEKCSDLLADKTIASENFIKHFTLTGTNGRKVDRAFRAISMILAMAEKNFTVDYIPALQGLVSTMQLKKDFKNFHKQFKDVVEQCESLVNSK